MVSVNDTIIVCAFRYCLGRSTYVVGDCVDCLLYNWPRIGGQARAIILRDINEAIQNGDYGMEMDGRQWERVLQKGREDKDG